MFFFLPQELDLRLNPVTKNEPDYRLFLVHMLVYLRKLGTVQHTKLYLHLSNGCYYSIYACRV